MKFEKVEYKDLNAKQQESYNYQKVSAVLADYGFITVPLNDDWNGADFLAVHKDGEVLKVQLKGRMTFDKKYLNKNIYICFRDGNDWYIYPHDEVFNLVCASSSIPDTVSWKNEGKYSFPNLSSQNKLTLKSYKMAA
jgi:hypothetical protein